MLYRKQNGWYWHVASYCHVTCHVTVMWPLQEIKSYPVQFIKLVEKLDEGAFHRKHMFQVVIVPSGPLVHEDESGPFTLYLQAGVSATASCLFVCWFVCLVVCLFNCLFVCFYALNIYFISCCAKFLFQRGYAPSNLCSYQSWVSLQKFQ